MLPHEPRFPSIVFGIGGVMAAHAVIRIWGAVNFDVDEISEVIHAQVFRLAYSAQNPPLYIWLLYIAQRLFAPSIVVTQALKYLLLAGGSWFLYAAVKGKFRHRTMLAAAVASYGLIAATGWIVHFQFTHTVTLYFALGFSFWAFMRVRDRGRLIDYALFGLAAGLGLMSKVAFALFLAALLAAVAYREERERFYSWKLIATGVIAAMIVSPFLIGLAGLGNQTAQQFAERTGASLAELPRNLGTLIVAGWAYTLPLLPVVWWVLRREAVALFGPLGNEAALARLLVRMIAWGVGITLVYVVAVGSTYTSSRLWTPTLTFLPLAVFACLDARADIPASIGRRMLQIGLACIGGTLLVRFLFFLTVAPPFCVPRCQAFIDYRPVAEAVMRLTGDQPFIVAQYPRIASNLMPLIPGARTVAPLHEHGRHPQQRRSTGCVLVWQHEPPSPPLVQLRHVEQEVPPAAGAAEAVVEIAAPWRTRVLASRSPVDVFGVAQFDPSHPICERYAW